MANDLKSALEAAKTEQAKTEEPNTAEQATAKEASPAADKKAAIKSDYEEVVRVYEPIRDDLGRSYATGKRKDAIARVWVKPGSGKVTVNGKEGQKYFARPVLWMLLNQPFGKAGCNDQFDVMCTVRGGGLSGQAGAVRHGISRALVNYDPAFRGALKAAGFLTRDSRIVERKKYGKAKARRSFQFSKR